MTDLILYHLSFIKSLINFHWINHRAKKNKNNNKRQSFCLRKKKKKKKEKRIKSRAIDREGKKCTTVTYIFRKNRNIRF